MIAIPMAAFQKLSSAMSRCKITEPQGNISYILDRNDIKVGEINWIDPSIVVYESYEYADEVLERLGKFTEVKRDYNISEQGAVDTDSMTLTELGESLYGKPTGIDKDEVKRVIDMF